MQNVFANPSRTIGLLASNAHIVRERGSEGNSHSERDPVGHGLDKTTVHHRHPDSIRPPPPIVGPVEFINDSIAQSLLGDGGFPAISAARHHGIECPSASICVFGISVDDEF